MGARNDGMAVEANNDQQASEHRFPLTPDSPLHPTILPHVKEPLEKLESITILPITPPSPASSTDATTNISSSVASAALLNGLHVLAAERDALSHLHHIYATDAAAQDSFCNAVALIANTMRKGGKLVVNGVGKSGKIGQKFVATCNSLRVLSVWLHPTEALHGDLGVIGPNDTLLLLTFSSGSPELHSLLPYIRANPLILLTGRPHNATNPNPLIASRVNCNAPSILLPASVPVPESELFRVSAPTTSTTVALALCDSLAIAAASALYGERLDSVFKGCHPGGAIGEAAKLGVTTVVAGLDRGAPTAMDLEDGGMEMG